MTKNTTPAAAPEWMRPENLRWAFCAWEPLAHMRRVGGKAQTFFGRTRWTGEWYEYLFSEKNVKRLAGLGVNMVITRFFKGMGLKFEKPEMEQTRRFVGLCHAHGIRVMGYTQFRSIYYETFLHEQPNAADWMQRNPDGSIHTWGDSYFRWAPCVNRREFVAYLKKVITYGLKTVGLDAIHMDNSYAEPCYCDTCTGKFRDYLRRNVDAPARLGHTKFKYVQQPPFRRDYDYIADPLYQEWIKFRVESLSRALSEIYQHVRATRPDAGLHTNPAFPRMHGWANRLSLHPYELGKCMDLMCAENGNFPRYDKPFLVSQIRAFKLADAGGYAALPSAWVRHETRGTICPSTAAEVKLSIAEPAAFGGIVGTTWGTRTVGRGRVPLDNATLSRPLKEYIRFLDRNRELYAGAADCAPVAMLHSFESHAYRGRQVSISAMVMEEVLIRNHIPYRLVFTENLDAVKDYKLLILPDQCCLSDAQVRSVIKFVRNGGSLLLTGQSGMFDENLLERGENAFAEILDLPRVMFLPEPFGQAGAGPDPDKWIHTHRVPLPRGHGKVARAIRRLLGGDLPLALKAPKTVVVNPRALPDGRMVIHLVNYNNRRPAKNIKLALLEPLSRFKHYRVFLPECKRQRKGGLRGAKTNIVLGRFDTYAVVELTES